MLLFHPAADGACVFLVSRYRRDVFNSRTATAVGSI